MPNQIFQSQHPLAFLVLGVPKMFADNNLINKEGLLTKSQLIALLMELEIIKHPNQSVKHLHIQFGVIEDEVLYFPKSVLRAIHQA